MRRPPQRLEVCGAEQPCEPDDRRGSQTGRACVGAGRGRGRGGAGRGRIGHTLESQSPWEPGLGAGPRGPRGWWGRCGRGRGPFRTLFRYRAGGRKSAPGPVWAQRQPSAVTSTGCPVVSGTPPRAPPPRARPSPRPLAAVGVISIPAGSLGMV